EHDVTLSDWSFLADHHVDGVPAVPAAAYVELALAALSQSSGSADWALDDVRFERLLAVDPDRPVRLRIVVDRDRQDQASVSISARVADNGSPADWIRHAHASAHAVSRLDAVVERSESLEALRGRCTREMPVAAHYDDLARHGLSYGASFRWVQQIWLGDDEAIVRVTLPVEASSASGCTWHPALLDAACFQGLALPGA